MQKINKKRAGALLVLTAMAAGGGFVTVANEVSGLMQASMRGSAYESQAFGAEVVTLSDKESLGEFVITAYCPCEKCCGEYADGITASGTVATEGRTCAVDPDVIPLGTEIEIDGVKYIAEDVGGAIKGRRIDICFNDHRSALQYGVKCKEVYVQ